MKHIKEYNLFIHRVGVIFFPEEEGITEIKPCCRIGFFYQHRFPELVEFCKKNPEYHIISKVSNASVFNKPIEYAVSFMLAEGDDDPQLAHLRAIAPNSFERRHRLYTKRQRREP